VGSFGYVGGNTYAVTTAIANTDDDVLYQSERWGLTAYTFYLPNGEYRVELLFAELWYTESWDRVFNVKIQGTTVLSNFCPGAAAGGRFIAVSYQFPATVTNGRLTIEFVAVNHEPKISAIGVEPLTAPSTATATATQTSSLPTPSATQTLVRTPTVTPSATITPSQPAIDIGINCGGAAYTATDGRAWQADKAYVAGSWGYVGGSIYTTGTSIAGTDDDTLYQSERWGMSAYRFTLPAGTYLVQIRFAEIYAWQKGQRVFDVQIEGATVISGLDIFAVAGRYTAHDRSFTVDVTDGVLDISFVNKVSYAKVNAIRVTALP